MTCASFSWDTNPAEIRDNLLNDNQNLGSDFREESEDSLITLLVSEMDLVGLVYCVTILTWFFIYSLPLQNVFLEYSY